MKNMHSHKQKLTELHNQNQEDMEQLKEALKIYQANMKVHKQPEWMTGKEVQDYLKISQATLKGYRQKGLIKYVVLNRLCRYKMVEVLGLMRDLL